MASVLVVAGVIGAHVALIYALDVGWYDEERTAISFGVGGALATRAHAGSGRSL